MAKTLSPAEKLLQVYNTIAPYANAASNFDRPNPNGTYDEKLLQTFRLNTQPLPLIDALLPQGGVVGIIQGINVASPGPHKHAHEYYLGRIEDCYFIRFHDDESHWQTKDHNGKLIERSYTLSAMGVRSPKYDSAWYNYNRTLRLVEPTYGNLEKKNNGYWLDHDDFSSFLQRDVVRFFEETFWQFKPNGDPSINAMRTADGKTVEPLGNLELLQALETHGHAQFPDQMIHYMGTLGAARG